MELEAVQVVLVRPARPANVAAACRAMKNMGLRRLTLVGAPAPFVLGEARNLAYGAWDVLDGARSAATLSEAVSDAAVVAGSSGRVDPGAVTARMLAEQARSLPPGQGLALVFGPEASGLTNDELALCHLRVRIPSHPEHPSLNLAQAVLVLAYELRLACAAGPPPPPAPRASAGELERMLAELGEGLLGIGYLNPQNPQAVLSELRRLLARAGPSARELALLRGLARQIRWAGARVAGRRVESDNPARSQLEEGAPMASELKVPTVAMTAEVVCVDGRAFRGRVFVPASSSLHGGPMRAEEWMNGAGAFFPFLPDDADSPVILNKEQVLAVSVGGDAEREAMEQVDIDRGVTVECGDRVLRGHLHIDMPPHHSRVLDYLNRGDLFLVLYEGDRIHLVRKQNITRVVEVGEP